MVPPMFGGSKYQAIFRSRWRAVLWSAGILMTAYCTVPREDGSDPTLEIAAAAAGQIAGQQQREEEAPRHVNPWALPPEQQTH